MTILYMVILHFVSFYTLKEPYTVAPGGHSPLDPLVQRSTIVFSASPQEILYPSLDALAQL